jgi:glycosyltransferase involved in cell wall biosynthesis
LKRKVLHVLPHPGGGAETYIDLLEGLGGYEHRRFALSGTRSRVRGVPEVLRRLGTLRRLAREADVVHFHGDMAAMLAAPGLRERPLVITAQGLHRLRRSTGLAGRVVRWRLRAAVAAASVVLCAARDERDDLAAALPPSLHDRLAIVHNGVPVVPADPDARRQARESLRLADGEVAVLFAAQLEERKDPLGAIAAVEAARARGGAVVLLLAGGGPLEAEVKAQAGPGVRVLGHRDDLENLYAAADLFLLPSHREGMSLALLEAMAHGLPPVVADGAGNAETVGAAGIVFPAGDIEAMAARLVELAGDAGARARLGAAARARIENELSLERFLAGTREQYEAAISATPQGA